MLDIFWGHFGSKSQVSGWTKMDSWAGAGRFYVLDTRSSPIVNFRSGECKYGQGQLCRAEFFYFYFEMFEVCGSKNLDHGKFRNSNQPEVGSMFGQIGATQPEGWRVISVKNAPQILKILCGQKWEVSGKFGMGIIRGPVSRVQTWLEECAIRDPGTRVPPRRVPLGNCFHRLLASNLAGTSTVSANVSPPIPHPSHQSR